MGLYYTDMLDVLVGAGCIVGENSTTNGWQTRARSSGGFPLVPLGCVWHHTASNTSPQNDLAYMIKNCPDAPVGNALVDRDGVWWPIAAGASNCAGKSETAKTFSRGTCPVSSGNTHLFNVEFANDGVGGPWPQVQVDSGFRGINAMNARFGNLPTDVISHALGSGDGYTNRKIDPSVASQVRGPWVPRSTNSSGTWSLADIRNECKARAGGSTPPQPQPQPPGDDDVEKILVRDVDGWPWVTDFASYATPLTEDMGARGRDMRGYSVGPDTGPWPIDRQDTELLHRIRGGTE